MPVVAIIFPKFLKFSLLAPTPTPPKPIKLKLDILRSLISRQYYTTDIGGCFCLLNQEDALDRNTHTHTTILWPFFSEPFYGLFSRTISVSQC